MAIVLQEIAGQTFGNRYYPTISGVARSLNFYPIGNEKSEEGIANIALGLGAYTVNGGLTLRFSPLHPRSVLQTSTLQLALKETQTQFYALNLENHSFDCLSIHDDYNLLRLTVKDAEEDGSLQYITSTYNSNDQILLDGYYHGKQRKILTFAGVLQHDVFPLATILDYMLKLGQEEMGRPIEIEFAVNLFQEDGQPRGEFYLLQIRPIVDSKEKMDEDLTLTKEENTVLYTHHALGHGINNDVCDIIYVKTAGFDAAGNSAIVNEIEKLNEQMVAANRNYVLVAPGRWGSSDPWLGIPVKWTQISNARVIVESGLENYRIEPSQGTHFFQNLTSFGVGYFTINPYLKDGVFDEAFLNEQPAVEETEHLRHVRFDKPMVIKIDGKKNIGLVMKPEKN
jgi:hypothetical protein